MPCHVPAGDASARRARVVRRVRRGALRAQLGRCFSCRRCCRCRRFSCRRDPRARCRRRRYCRCSCWRRRAASQRRDGRVPAGSARPPRLFVRARARAADAVGRGVARDDDAVGQLWQLRQRPGPSFVGFISRRGVALVAGTPCERTGAGLSGGRAARTGAGSYLVRYRTDMTPNHHECPTKFHARVSMVSRKHRDSSGSAALRTDGCTRPTRLTDCNPRPAHLAGPAPITWSVTKRHRHRSPDFASCKNTVL